MKKHTCHFDLHQRSRYVTIGQRNWVRKLIENQKGKLLDNQKEKLLDKQNSSNQPNQSQSQSVIDQGNLITRKTSLLLKVTQEISVKSFHEELCSSDRSGQLGITQEVFKHVHLKTARVSMLGRLMIDQGNLINTTLQYKTTLK